MLLLFFNDIHSRPPCLNSNLEETLDSLKRTGPSSGVVASIVLVSKGLDCPGVSLAEVCAICLRCHLW